MKRSSTDASLDRSTTTSTQQAVRQGLGQAPTQRQRDTLDVDSAGREAVRLLISSPPQAKAFADLLDDMHEQGIDILKLGAEIGTEGYELLVKELSQAFRLRDQLRGFDFSYTVLPQFTSLAQAIARNHHGQLRYLNLSNTHFPAARGSAQADPNEKIPLQAHHLKLVLDIVKANPELSYLNLNHQDLLGSKTDRSSPWSFQRDAPIYHLMKHCLHSKIEVLELQACWLSNLDLRDIADMLYASRANGQQCLRVLALQGNDPQGQFDWRFFLKQLNGHPSLAQLALPDAAYNGASGYLALDDEHKKAVAQSLSECPELSYLEPRELARDPHVEVLLWRRDTELRNARFMNMVLSVRSVAPLSTDNLGQVLTHVARLEKLNPEQVLPARLNISLDKDKQTL